jgi:hypothetical protein
MKKLSRRAKRFVDSANDLLLQKDLSIDGEMIVQIVLRKLLEENVWVEEVLTFTRTYFYSLERDSSKGITDSELKFLRVLQNMHIGQNGM